MNSYDNDYIELDSDINRTDLPQCYRYNFHIKALATNEQFNSTKIPGLSNHIHRKCMEITQEIYIGIFTDKQLFLFMKTLLDTLIQQQSLDTLVHNTYKFYLEMAEPLDPNIDKLARANYTNSYNNFTNAMKTDIYNFSKHYDQMAPLMAQLATIGYKQRIDAVNTDNRYKELYMAVKSCYRHFFKLYLKGGAANRFTVYYINSIAGENIFTPVEIKKELGDTSDYDYNLIISPHLHVTSWQILFNRLNNIIRQYLNYIVVHDPFFTDNKLANAFNNIISSGIELIEGYKASYKELGQTIPNGINLNIDRTQYSPVIIREGLEGIFELNKIYDLDNQLNKLKTLNNQIDDNAFKIQNNFSDVRQPGNNLGFHNSFSFPPPNGFNVQLIRLMLKKEVILKSKICKDYDGSDNKAVSFATELIDISIPYYSQNATGTKYDNTRGRDISFPVPNKKDDQYVINSELLQSWEFVVEAIEIPITCCDHDKVSCISCAMLPTVYVYNMDSIINDLDLTLRESIARGDMTKVPKRQARLAFFKKYRCFYKMIVDRHTGYLNNIDMVPGYCDLELDKIWPFVYHNPLVDQILFTEYLTGVRPDKRGYMIKVVERTLDKIVALTGNQIITNAVKVLKNSLASIDLTSSVSETYFNEIFSKLIPNYISLTYSLNDDYIHQFIVYSYLKSTNDILIAFTNNTLDKTTMVGYSYDNLFEKTVISQMERYNNIITRPIVKEIAIPILQTLVNSLDNIALGIRGGLACHLYFSNVIQEIIGLYKLCLLDNRHLAEYQTTIQRFLNTTTTIGSMGTNDMDLILYTVEPDLIVKNLDSVILPMVQQMNHNYQHLGVTISTRLLGDVYQLVLKVQLPTNEQLAINGQAIVTNTIHHIVEIQIVYPKTSQTPNEEFIETAKREIEKTSYYLIDTNLVKINNKNFRLFVYRPDYIIKEYNNILREHLHWYRKHKYIRRIAALSSASKQFLGVIDSEFASYP
jgi:hypothetical protein